MNREYEDDYDEDDDIEDGKLCFHCRKWNEPIRADYLCKYCFHSLK